MKIGQTFSYLEGRWKKHNICPHAAASIFYFKTLLQKYGFWNVSIASESYLFEHVFFAKFWMTQLNWSARWSQAKVTDTHVNRANTIGSHFTLASDKQRKKKQSNKIIIKETMKQYYSPNQALKIVFKNTKSFNCFIFSELEVWNTIQFSWKKCLQPPKLLFDPMKNQNFKVVLP